MTATTQNIAAGNYIRDELVPLITPHLPPPEDPFRSLAIFYAPPQIANLKYSDDYAAGIFSRYDDIVFGTGLEDPGSAYYASTTAIIGKIRTLNKRAVVWGYIDTGITTGNIPLNTLKTQIDQWVAIGANGIFCDVIGYAYGVDRTRQNAIINYIHGKGVGAILNVYDSDEVLGSAVNATYNPSGTPTVANSRDILLLESWVFNSDAYATPYYTTFSDIKFRAEKALAYREAFGVRIVSSNIIKHTGLTKPEVDAYRNLSEALARIFRFDGDGISSSGYAASGSDVGLIRQIRSPFTGLPGSPSGTYQLNGAWTEISASDLGLQVNYSTGTHTWTLD